MKKICHLEVDCPACASKIESSLLSISGIKKASVNIIFQKITLEIEDANLSQILKEAKHRIANIEPDAYFTYAE